MINPRAKSTHSHAITAQLVRDDHSRCAPPLHEFAQEPLGGTGVSASLHKDFKCIPVAIDRTPEPVLLPADRDHNLVQMPLVGGLRSITPDLRRNLRSKFRHPDSDRLVTDRDAALCQKTFDVLLIVSEN